MNPKTSTYVTSIVAPLALAFAIGVVACENQGPAEKVGEKMDEAADDSKAAARDAGAKVGDAIEDAGDEMEDAVD